MDLTEYSNDNGAGTAVAMRSAPRPAGLLRVVAEPHELIQAQEETRTLIEKALLEGRDYGLIPGVDKPSLLKPGAERVSAAFGCYTRFRIVDQEIDHDREVHWVKRKKMWENRKFVGWNEEKGSSFGLYRYVVACDLVHRESGIVVGSCLGACSTMESKYVDRPRDSENTVLKMAEKRAHVGAVLVTFGLSQQFTQDVEEAPELHEPDPDAPVADPNEPQAKCPKCQGKMWDNRAGKTNPKAPDFKCRDKDCDGVMWPGQWPPKPAASEEERAALTELLTRFVDPGIELQKRDSSAVGKASKMIEDAACTSEHMQAAIKHLQQLVEKYGIRVAEPVEPLGDSLPF